MEEEEDCNGLLWKTSDINLEEPQFHVLSEMSHKLQLVSTMHYLLIACSEYMTRPKEPCMRFYINFELLSLNFQHYALFVNCMFGIHDKA